MVFLYFPTAQAVQVPPLGPVYPLLHAQCVTVVHAAPRTHEAPELAGHEVQERRFGAKYRPG